MAFRTEAQTVTLFQSAQLIADLVEEFVPGVLLGAVQKSRDALYPDTMSLRGIEGAENAALTDVLRAAAGLSSATRAYIGSLVPELGYLSGCANPLDVNLSLASFFDYLITASHKVANRGLTKATSWTAGGSNIGDPTVFYFDSDQNSLTLDVSHAGTLRLECTRDQYNGASEGNEEWTVTGSALASYSWDEGGPGNNGGGYTWKPGVGQKDFGFGQPFAVMGGTIRGASASQNNILTNGDLEATFISGGTTDKVPGYVLNSSYANVSANTTDPISGDQDIQFASGGAVIKQLLPSNIRTACAYGYQLLLRTHSADSGTVTGNFTVVVKDDTTTHATVTVALGGLTLDTATKMGTSGKSFYLPATVGENLRIEITSPSLGGTGTTPVVDMDQIVLVPLTIVDGGRATAVVNSLIAPRYRDYFTNVTSTVDTGRMQYWWNRDFGKYLPHDTSATTWLDVVRAPAIGVSYNSSSVAEGGTIALGSVATGAHALSISISNTGNKDLTVLVPSHGTDTNISSVGVDYTVALVVKPFTSRTVVLTVTDGGAGAFATTMSFVSNDGSSPRTFIVSGTAT